MIVVSTGASTTCLGAFLAAVVGGLVFLAVCLVTLLLARRALDFTFLGAARVAAFLRARLARALLRFKCFLRVAIRFFALAMFISRDVSRRQANLEAREHC